MKSSINQKRISLRVSPPAPHPPRSFPWLFFLALLFCSWFIWQSLVIHLPEPFAPPKLYSNQCRQNIQATLLRAIHQAHSSIHLVMFGLSDRPILSALKQKIDKNLSTTIYYDRGGSPKIHRHLQGAHLHPIKNVGLMHQKILILDEELIFIGSANMTSASLRMHDNLVVGFYSRSMAQFLKEHKPYTPGYFRTAVGGQEVELWLLPDPRGHALNELKKKIRSALSSIRIALFTFTHPSLIEEVIAAHERGVKVSIVVDMHSGLGASAKALEKLKQAAVPIRISQGPQLLHHKFIYIDEKTLITGSANWTKAAFYKNSDCIIALHHLNADQKRFMNDLWHTVATTTQTIQSP